MNNIYTILTAIIIFIGISLLLAYPTKICWNLTMPDIFGLKEITVLQGLCLNILCGILIKGNK